MEHPAGEDGLRPFPELPVELVLQIFALTCEISHEIALKVSTVSKVARHACLPYVFATIVRRAGAPTTWATNDMAPRRERLMSHLLPPTSCGVYVRHLWIESINMMSSPGELSVLVACPNLEDVALTAKSLRVLHTSMTFNSSRVEQAIPQRSVSHLHHLTLLEPTFRYDWHWLAGVDQPFVNHITHLRLLNMQQSSYVPIDLLPNLTHIALPYLHLRTNRAADLLRLPDGIIERATLQMIVLTVDEQEWLYKPWQHRGIPHNSAGMLSPRERFRIILRHALQRDQRLYLVLSPTIGRSHCAEWVESKRGQESLWEKAARVGQDESYADVLPETFPSTDLRFTTSVMSP